MTSGPIPAGAGQSVAVLGHRGMLGTMVAARLRERGYRVLTVEDRYGGRPDDPLVAAATRPEVDAVVNCLGVVPAAGGTHAMMSVNGLLPVHLAAALEGRRLIHASTDCVFDGQRGWYRVSDTPIATDAYGLSKRVGEACLHAPGTVVLRVSIVGPPAGAGRGLLGWFLAQDGPVDGYANHQWNGITTLAWADLAALALAGDGIGPGLHQPATSVAVSKLELLRMFSRVFDRPTEIRPRETPESCDRTLAPTLDLEPIEAQLVALRAWMAGSPESPWR